jgi:hypothetical protein
VLREIPAIGYYLVQVPIGTEGAFINSIKADSRVLKALPNPVGMRGSAPGVWILEGCGDDHDARVEGTLEAEGGSVGSCQNIQDSKHNIDGDEVMARIVTVGNVERTDPALVNLSSYGSHLNGIQFDGLTLAEQVQAQNEWVNFMSIVLDAIGDLPPAYRDNLVITMCAGNNNMDITGLMAVLRQNPDYAAILHNNVLIVGTDLMQGNFSPNDPDFAYMNNPEAANGTSFAAPGAMAIIQKIMNETGASAKVALQAAKAAIAKNAGHQLVKTEAVLTLTITKAGNGTGTVTATAGAATPNEPGPKYTLGAIVTLTEQPGPGSTFGGWSGDAGGTASSTTVTMTANKAVTATFNAPVNSLSLAITSQTWTPNFFNGQLVSYSVVVTGTASGPVGSGLGVVSFDFGSVANFATPSWTATSNTRGPTDPATTTWLVSESFAGTDEVLTISLGNAFTNPSEIFVHASPP